MRLVIDGQLYDVKLPRRTKYKIRRVMVFGPLTLVGMWVLVNLALAAI